jgi:Uncharacterized conserved protein (DUF2249)
MTTDPKLESAVSMPHATMRVIDVRPDVEANGEPFLRVLAAADASVAGDTFVVIAPFEPLAIYPVLTARGFRYQTEHLGPGEWRTRFSLLRTTTSGPVTRASEERPHA